MFNFKSFFPDSPLSTLIIIICIFIFYLFTKRSTISKVFFLSLLFLSICLIFFIIDYFRLRKEINNINQKISKESVKAAKKDLNFDANNQNYIGQLQVNVIIKQSSKNTTTNAENDREDNNENK